MQSERKRSKEQPAAPTESAPMIETSTSTEPALSDKNRKRKARPEDEIDALFNNKLGKKIKKAALSQTTSTLDGPSEVIVVKDVAARKEDKELDQVLGAIRLAPKDHGYSKKKKQKGK